MEASGFPETTAENWVAIKLGHNSSKHTTDRQILTWNQTHKIMEKILNKGGLPWCSQINVTEWEILPSVSAGTKYSFTRNVF